MSIRASKSFSNLPATLSRSFSINKSRSRSLKDLDAQEPKQQYILHLVASKRYKPGNPQEIELVEGEMLHVIEEKDLFYYVYSPLSQKQGYVPKNYTKAQKPLSVVPATIKQDISGEDIYFQGERLILLARINPDFVFFKKMNRDQTTGRIEITSILPEGEIETLPSFDEYQSRKMLEQSKSLSTTPIQRSRTNSKSRLMEDKTVDKLQKTMNRSSSYGKGLKDYLSPKIY
eukprot:NODE_398_length_8105_cov_1.375094.p5 type:complete len:231 gc:universal NODE_398_length_8105_cov_1.375094:4095-3403(-)